MNRSLGADVHERYRLHQSTGAAVPPGSLATASAQRVHSGLQAALRAAFPFVADAADRGLHVYLAKPPHSFHWHCRCYYCRQYYSRHYYRR